jgi:PIN domain nuclease of toxin-antitoxin system
MNLLLDTHAFLWFVEENAKLSAIARSAIENPQNQKWVSIASCWKISIKVGIGKLQVSDPVDLFLNRELTVPAMNIAASVEFYVRMGLD